MKRLALALTMSLAAATLGAQASRQIPVTTVATLPSGGELNGGMTESPGGKLIYYSTTAGINVYDRTTKSSTMAVKGDFGGQIGISPAGDWLIMTREAEGTKPTPNSPKYIWTVPVNPRTGAASGEPRRVSTTPAEGPAFSPDGKSIAFIATGNSRRLMVIPAAGGTERVLFERNRPAAPVSWSADGKWIFASQSAGGAGNPAGILRVSVEGGTPTQVKAAGDMDIMAPDGRHIVGVSGGLRGLSAEVFDMNGVVLDSMTPLAPLDGVPCGIGWANDGLKVLLLVIKGSTAVQTHTLEPATDRSFTLQRPYAREPSLSPDGKLVAVAVAGDSSDWTMAIFNADGSGQRNIQPLQSTSDLDQAIWAPDSKHFAFPGASRHALYVADATTGQVTKVGSAELRVGDYRWLPDSRTLMYSREDGTSTKMIVSVHATSPEGRDRLLRDLTPSLPAQGTPWYGVSWFLGDSAVVVIRLGLVIPIHGGAARTLYSPASSDRVGIGATTAADGSWIARRSNDSTALELFPADGKPARVLRAPAGIDFRQLPYQQPDPRAIVVSAIAKANGPTTIYRIPIDGGAAKVLTTIPAGDGLLDLMVSPDGKQLIFVRNTGAAITLVEADLAARVPAKPPVKN